MQFQPVSVPAFGEADLSNCENEQIHLAGSIQPHGALMVINPADQVIVQASDNTASLLKLPFRDVVGKRLRDISEDVWRQVAPHLEDPVNAIPTAIRCTVGAEDTAYDGLLHRQSDRELILELEVARSDFNPVSQVERILASILGATSLRDLCDTTARTIKKLAGYDRVMVYRFDEHGHGEIYSEAREPELEAFLGNWYPASDIPQMARRLYVRNRVRVLVDIDYVAVPVSPAVSPVTGQQLDMSLCSLRSMSPIHIQYLKNMGVGATLVISLVVGGKLWGLIASHHYAPHNISYEMRTTCELLAETVATRIAALESYDRADTILSVRRLEQRMSETVARDGDWRSALFDSAHALLDPLEATGAALVFEDQILSVGQVPSSRELHNLVAWLDTRRDGKVIATSAIAQDNPDLASLTASASGVLATPISSDPGEYLIWVRPERVRTITWGGDPRKPFVVGDNPADLSPRRSFAQFHQLVEGTSLPWTEKHIGAARLFGDSISDVILQFRSVRALIARDQLRQVSDLVESSPQPVVISDAEGRIVIMSETFRDLLGMGAKTPETVADFARIFDDPAAARQKIDALIADGRSWVGEADVLTTAGRTIPVLIRADRVATTQWYRLGYVFLLTDITEQREVGHAREKFHRNLSADRTKPRGVLDPRAERLFQNLLSSVVGNAQLAALEVTDDVDFGRIPELLEGIRASADRTAQLLEHLIWHSSSTAGAPNVAKFPGRGKPGKN